MTPFTFGSWHAWQGQACILLSDEKNKTLTYHTNTHECINHLWYLDNAAARALNKHIKETA